MISLPTTPRWQEILLIIYRSPERYRYCEKLIKHVKGSRTYFREIVRQLADHDLIQIVPTKKIKKLELTEKGHRLILTILNMRSELGQF